VSADAAENLHNLVTNELAMASGVAKEDIFMWLQLFCHMALRRMYVLSTLQGFYWEVPSVQ
jgi:hypothetical protein